MGINEDEKDKNKIKKIIPLLFALRFIFSILLFSKKNKNKSEGFYLNLLTKNIASILESGFVPGNFKYGSLKIESFNEIKKNLKEQPLKYGAYLCSCGYHYSVDKCTFPTIEFKCPICKEWIGGKNHKLVRRNGHRRVFFDEESRSNKLKPSYADKTIPNILLKDLEKEIEEEKNGIEKGLKPINMNEFLTEEEKVRKMDDITYRFLN